MNKMLIPLFIILLFLISPVYAQIDVPREDAVEIGIADAGGYYTGTEVEAALQEIGAGTAIDHGLLQGLADDDHTQYQKETDFTAGSILFRGASVITEDNANFFWDDTLKRFGIGTPTPSARVDIVGDEILTGADVADPTLRSDNANKKSFFTIPSYDTDEERIMFIAVDIESGNTTVTFGGTGITYNTPTIMDFRTGDSITDLTAKARLRVDTRFLFNPDGYDMNFIYRDATGTNLLFLDAGAAEVRIPQDNAPLVFGAGQDAKCYYNGTNLICDPDLVGTGHLQIHGTYGTATETVSANTTLDATHSTVLVDASGGARTITLPAVSGVTSRIYEIKKIDSSGNTVTVDGSGSEEIDGATTAVITVQYESITIQNNGTAWYIL